MRCRACDSEFDDFMRRVKEGGKFYQVPEDLCYQCRNISYRTYRGEDIEDDLWITQYINHGPK